jgi:N-methylhydantoinase A
VAFGGGGGMHATALAAELGITKVIIPHAADVFAAWGMLMSDLRRDLFLTKVARFESGSVESIARALSETQQAALSQFVEEGVGADSVSLASHAKLRYENQEHSVEVPLPPGGFDSSALELTIGVFHDRYEREYTYRLAAPIELVGLHIVATATVGKLRPSELPVSGRTVEAAVKGLREVDYAPDGDHRATIYDGTLLEPGMRAGGPAVIETAGTTIVVRPSDRF